MGRPDYSQWESFLFSDSERINNEMYATGILGVYDKYTSLLKVYGRIIGDTIRYQIFYVETVDSDWSKKNPNYLSREEQDFLTGFNERANASFSVINYSGTPPFDQDNSTGANTQIKKNNPASMPVSANDQSTQNNKIPLYENKSTASQPELQASSRNHVAVFPSIFDLDAKFYNNRLDGRVAGVVADST